MFWDWYSGTLCIAQRKQYPLQTLHTIRCMLGALFIITNESMWPCVACLNTSSCIKSQAETAGLMFLDKHCISSAQSTPNRLLNSSQNLRQGDPLWFGDKTLKEAYTRVYRIAKSQEGSIANLLDLSSRFPTQWNVTFFTTAQLGDRCIH